MLRQGRPPLHGLLTPSRCCPRLPNGMQLLRDTRWAHSQPRLDPTGVGQFTTPNVSSRLRDVAKEAEYKHVVFTAQGRTTVAWTPRRGREDDDKNRPWMLREHSRGLGRRNTNVTVKLMQGSSPQTYRATCDGWNCSRHGSPCSCLLLVYPGPLVPEDLHPGMLRDSIAGARDDNLPSGPYEGLFVGPTRRDCFGMLAKDRVACTDDLTSTSKVRLEEACGVAPGLSVDCNTGHAAASNDERSFEGLEDEEHERDLFVLTAGEASETGAATAQKPVPRPELMAAATRAVQRAGSDPVLTAWLLQHLEAGTEHLRQTSTTYDGSGSAQGIALMGPNESSTSVKLGGKRNRQVEPAAPHPDENLRD